ncbi:hypothetical protein [Pseudomonas syringae group genomosp. 3]|uniref:Uncharacterized protein n=1 Tax=Pseudomonas syringae pv. persicae TaxID=237306 RepID=A0AB38EDG0_9PSED|nr:hypothetical protein [Pseudomonas syringae group genomosp. 3]SOQ09182.1 hypothetical protein NCPPB2254_02223 [Pseudomonas syringae pv. persicae]SOQ09239.1 hypothetical protein CFBP1573P_02397 [Pseudomonas syringae pv. persicae]
MFPVTIEGIRYPQHFETQGEAMAAAYKFFEGRSRARFNVIRRGTDNGGVYYVLQDNKGNALPLPEVPLPVRPSKAA